VQDERIHDLEQQLSSLYVAFEMLQQERSVETERRSELQSYLNNADSTRKLPGSSTRLRAWRLAPRTEQRQGRPLLLLRLVLSTLIRPHRLRLSRSNSCVPFSVVMAASL